MAGTKAGALKSRATILAKDPEFYKRIGQKGGQNGRTGGFACSEVGEDGLTGAERAKVAGAKGGRISRCGSKKARKINVRNINEDSAHICVIKVGDED
uniref:general stress protein n=1 Tax=Alloprevotella sp. TaxID=1872471 RepID=UPI003FF0A2A3